jgi:hypothetical protein
MLSFVQSPARDAGTSRLTGEDLIWLRQLATVLPTRPLVPMRTTERLGKLGLIELRARTLMITDKGRQYLRRVHNSDFVLTLN